MSFSFPSRNGVTCGLLDLALRRLLRRALHGGSLLILHFVWYDQSVPSGDISRCSFSSSSAFSLPFFLCIAMSTRGRQRKRANTTPDDLPINASDCIDDAAVESDSHGEGNGSDLTELSEDPGSLKDFIVDDEAPPVDDRAGDDPVDDDNATLSTASILNGEDAPRDVSRSGSVTSKSASIEHDSEMPVPGPADEDRASAGVDVPVESTSSQTKRKRRHHKTVPDSDDDKDSASMLVDGDRMFSSSRGVKSSLLAPPLKTRSSSKLTEDTPMLPAASQVTSSSAAIDPADKIGPHDSSDSGEDTRHAKKPRVAGRASSSKKLSKKRVVPADAASSNAIEGTVRTLMQSELPSIADAVLARLLPALKDVLSGAAPRQPAESTPHPISVASHPADRVDDNEPIAPTPAVPVLHAAIASAPARSSELPSDKPSLNAESTEDTSSSPGSATVPSTTAVIALQPSAMETSPRGDTDLAPSSGKLPIGDKFVSLSTQSPVTPSRSGSDTKPTNASSKLDMSSMVFFSSSSSVAASLAGSKSQPSATDASPTKPKVLPGLEGMASAKPVKDEPVDTSMPPAGDGSFLDDLEAYKLRYNPTFPCQVADPELQDKLLVESYEGLPPLPNRPVLPSFTRNDTEDDTKGGRIIFSVWPKVIKNCTAVTISGAVTFEKSGLYINPSRVSPLDVTVRPTKSGSKTTTHMRINVGNSVATCVSCGMCVESWVTKTTKTFGPSPREYKSISLVMHNQDWERFAAWMCLCFNEQQLYASMSDRAIQIRSMMSDAEDGKNTSRTWADNINPDIMKPVRSANSSPTKYKAKYALSHDETVPVYDSTNRDLDMDDDLQSLVNLPRWRGEIPVGSFVVVGYSASTYPGTAGGSGPKVAHLSCNLLWAIVCGIPK